MINRIKNNWQNWLSGFAVVIFSAWLALWNTMEVSDTNVKISILPAIGIFVVLLAVMMGIIWIANRKGFENNSAISKSHLFNSFWKVFFVVLVVWTAMLMPILPFTGGFDIVSQINEVLGSAETFRRIGFISPADVYPIADYLRTTDATLTNQHGVLLTLLYGGVVKVGWMLTHSLYNGLAVLGMSQLLITAASFSYALKQLYRVMSSEWAKWLVLAIVLFNPTIMLNSIALNKNPLFAALFVLFIGLMIEGLNKHGRVSVGWQVLMMLDAIGMTITVKWGFVVFFVVGVVTLILYRSQWRLIMVNMLLPMIMVKIILAGLTGAGLALPDDPIESKTVQLQQIARYLKYYPDDISKTDKQLLDKIVVEKNLAGLYNPDLADSLKSSGYGKFVDANQLGYRYHTVQEKDMQHFNKIWIDLLKRHPGVYVAAFIANNDGYFSVSKNAFPDGAMTTMAESSVGVVKDVKVPDKSGYYSQKRESATKFIVNLQKNALTSWMFKPSVAILLMLLLLPVLIQKKQLWLVLAVGAQIAILLISPVNGSMRYSLGVVYSLPIVLGLVFTPCIRLKTK